MRADSTEKDLFATRRGLNIPVMGFYLTLTIKTPHKVNMRLFFMRISKFSFCCKVEGECPKKFYPSRYAVRCISPFKAPVGEFIHELVMVLE